MRWVNAGLRPALYTCGKYGTGHAAHPYFEGPRTRSWREHEIAPMYGTIYKLRIVVRGFPPYKSVMSFFWWERIDFILLICFHYFIHLLLIFLFISTCCESLLNVDLPGCLLKVRISQKVLARGQQDGAQLACSGGILTTIWASIAGTLACWVE